MIELWDLWFPNAAATGLPFARGRMNATDRLIVHAPPPTLNVEVRGEFGELLASGKNLERTDDCPMAFLSRQGDSPGSGEVAQRARGGETVTREDRWPTETDLNSPVILPGGEVGRLTAWWNAPDGSEWRWSVEFYNHR